MIWCWFAFHTQLVLYSLTPPHNFHRWEIFLLADQVSGVDDLSENKKAMVLLLSRADILEKFFICGAIICFREAVHLRLTIGFNFRIPCMTRSRRYVYGWNCPLKHGEVWFIPSINFFSWRLTAERMTGKTKVPRVGQISEGFRNGAWNRSQG